MVVFLYIGFTVFDVLLAGPAVQVVWPSVSYTTAATVIVILTWVIAIAGHDLLHLLERWLGYITFVLFGVFTPNALFNAPAGIATAGVGLGYNAHAFMLQCKRRPRPIDFTPLRYRGRMKRRAAGSSSGHTTRHKAG